MSREPPYLQISPDDFRLLIGAQIALGELAQEQGVCLVSAMPKARIGAVQLRSSPLRITDQPPHLGEVRLAGLTPAVRDMRSDQHQAGPAGVSGFVDETIDFCLEQHPSVEIDITLNPDFSASVNAVPPPCPDSLTATANLGHESGVADPDRRSARCVSNAGVSGGDRDTFTFESDAGEIVTITLAGEGSAGHVGELAALQLLFEDVVIAEIDGPLPLDLSATLLEPGEYHIAVLEQTVGDGDGADTF